MAESPVLETLRNLPHFSSLDPATLDRIAAASRMLSLSKGGKVMLEGEPCRGFFVVRTGGVRIYRVAPDGKEQLLQRVGPGRSFAEAALLTMHRYPASAEATATPTEVVEVGGETFLDLFDRDRRLARSMVSSLSTWLLRLVKRVEDLTVMSAGARLARFLLDLPAKGAGDRLTVRLPLPKKELAATLGITPETLSRLLRRWQDRGIVESARSTVVITDAETLTAIAADRGG